MSWAGAAAITAIVGILVSGIVSIFSNKQKKICSEKFKDLEYDIRKNGDSWRNAMDHSFLDRKEIREIVVRRNESIVRLETEMKAVRGDVKDLNCSMEEVKSKLIKILTLMPKRNENHKNT